MDSKLNYRTPNNWDGVRLIYDARGTIWFNCLRQFSEMHTLAAAHFRGNDAPAIGLAGWDARDQAYLRTAVKQRNEVSVIKSAQSSAIVE
jgi:hypothetical protein